MALFLNRQNGGRCLLFYRSFFSSRCLAYFDRANALQRPIFIVNVARALIRIAQLSGNVSSLFIATAGQKGVAMDDEK